MKPQKTEQQIYDEIIGCSSRIIACMAEDVPDQAQIDTFAANLETLQRSLEKLYGVYLPQTKEAAEKPAPDGQIQYSDWLKKMRLRKFN